MIQQSNPVESLPSKWTDYKTTGFITVPADGGAGSVTVLSIPIPLGQAIFLEFDFTAYLGSNTGDMSYGVKQFAVAQNLAGSVATTNNAEFSSDDIGGGNTFSGISYAISGSNLEISINADASVAVSIELTYRTRSVSLMGG